ncbi:MAG TPA: tetratricopeptide repeat-containing protein kinase family protein, partial [Gemmataceae bacterium]|nr:tetratricopeptide repeat-containing protein kinase family protein [Gemmataceae bacterium]
VMVGAHGEVQVMDWGLAKVLHPSPERERGEEDDPAATVAPVTAIDTPSRGDAATRTGSVLGTPSYMPPEQAGGEIRKLDARSDVFGLGAILCQILTGQPPYRGADGNEVRLQAVRWEMADAFARLDACGAEPELIALCKRCLAREQADRPADGNAVAQQVAAIRQASEERARQAEIARAQAQTQAAEQAKRRRLAIAAGGVIAAVLLAGLSLSLWQMNRAVIAEGQARENERQALANAELARSNEAKAVAERDAKEIALQAEKKAREESADRLAQIELINNSVFDIFTDFDIRKVKAGPDPVEYVLTERLIAAGRKLDEKAIRDPLVLAKLRDRLGRTLLSLGRAKEAIEFVSWARETRQAKLGPDHPDTLNSMGNLALGYRAAGKLDQALPLYEETLRLTKAKLGPDHPSTLISMHNLAGAYQAAGKLDQALPLLEETLRLMKAKLGPDHPHTLTSMGNLGGAYCAAKQGEKAGPLLKEFVAGQRKRFPKDDPRFASLLAQVALELLKCGQFAPAEEMLRECLAIREKKQPDAWTTFNTMSMLGGALLGQKKYADAEPLLLKGYEGMKAREKTIPPQAATRLPEALDRLIELYEALNKPEEVARWRKERARHRAPEKKSPD